MIGRRQMKFYLLKLAIVGLVSLVLFVIVNWGYVDILSETLSARPVYRPVPAYNGPLKKRFVRNLVHELSERKEDDDESSAPEAEEECYIPSLVHTIRYPPAAVAWLPSNVTETSSEPACRRLKPVRGSCKIARELFHGDHQPLTCDVHSKHEFCRVNVSCVVHARVHAPT
jgi:hypothetical protein